MAITNLNTGAGTSILLAHFDNPNREDFNMDIYFYYEVIGQNADNSTRLLTGLYWEFNLDTTQNIDPRRPNDHQWYPNPEPDAGELGLAWARSDRGFKVNAYLYSSNPYVPEDESFSHEILKWNNWEIYDNLFFKSWEVIGDPWEEELDVGITIQYRPIRCWYREWGYQKEVNIQGGTTISGNLYFRDTDNYIVDPDTQTITFPLLAKVPVEFSLKFSDYISFTSVEASTDINPINFTLYNLNGNYTLNEVYIELVTDEDRNYALIPRVDLTKNFSTLDGSLMFDGPEMDIPGSEDALEGTTRKALWEYMYDKKESDFYLKLSYRLKSDYTLMTSYAKVHIQLHEVYSGTPVELYPQMTYSAVDINPRTKTLTGDSRRFVRYFSNVEAKLDVRPMKCAQIVSQGIRTTEATVGTDYYLFEGITASSINFFATDSRGYFTAKLSDTTFLEYVKPTCNITNIGLPEVDDTCEITLSGMYWDNTFGQFHNELTLWYRYKSTSIADYVDWIEIPNPQLEDASGYNYNAIVTVNLPNHVDRFTIQVMAKDMLASAESQERTVRAYPIFDWSENDFHFNIPVKIDGDLEVTGTITSNTPEAQTIDHADYIVEQGTKQTGSGNAIANWVYRKWNSGIAECWCQKHIATAVSNTWGNLYVSGSLTHTNILWPVTFTEIPVATITLAPNASGAFLIAGGSTALTKTNTGGYEIARGTTLSSGNFYINYYGIGRWK